MLHACAGPFCGTSGGPFVVHAMLFGDVDIHRLFGRVAQICRSGV